MRKVYLDELPRWEEGRLKGKFDWNRCVGHNVEFVYDDIKGIFSISGYDTNTRLLKIAYHDKEYKIFTSNFIYCNLGILLGKINGDFKIMLGERFINKNKDLFITDRRFFTDDKNNKWKEYKYKCNICGFNSTKFYKDGVYNEELWISESNLLKDIGCSCCNGRSVVYGINSIHDTAPWMIGLGVDFEEAKKFTYSSGKKIKCICPYCGEKYFKTCDTVYKCKSIGCKCGDGKSYISKYIYFLLKQLKLNFQAEVKYSWNKYINPKNNKLSQARIDFVIYYNDREIPIEADGGFHRKDNNLSGQTKEQSEYIDKQRDDNCLKYLGEETIRISDEGDVKENILNSKLNELFDFSNVDWLKCEEFALKNLVKDVCDYWNNKEEWETTTDLINVFNADRGTIIKYLKRGAIVGWCMYDSKEESIKGQIKAGKSNGKKVEVFKDGKSFGVFDSTRELERVSDKVLGVKIFGSNVAHVCLGKRKSSQGYTFRYVDDINNELQG